MRKIKFLLFRLKWHIAPYINFKAPVHVDIELTSVCNLSCIFCHQQNRKYKLGAMSLDKVKDILQQCYELGVKSVKFNWRGESTLHKNFPEILEIAHNYGFFIYCNTNLYVTDKGKLLSSLAKWVDVLKVSIDTMQHHAYRNIRKGSDLSTVITNLMILARLRRKYKMPPVIVSRRTIPKMETDEEFKSWFIKSSEKFKFDIRPAMPRNKSNIFGKQKARKRKYCGQPSRRLVIGWDGKVFTCCVAYNEPRNLCLIINPNINAAWNNGNRETIIDNLKKGYGYPIDCDSCTSKDAYK